jgi:hypothetical protein
MNFHSLLTATAYEGLSPAVFTENGKTANPTLRFVLKLTADG